MERFKRSFSFRKKKDHVPESHKPHQWQEDERKVREGTCSFQVRIQKIHPIPDFTMIMYSGFMGVSFYLDLFKYLGCIEVFESRGIQVCEEAVKALKSKNSRSVWSRMSLRRKKNKENQQCKGKYQRAILYVSGDALRVVDEISKRLGAIGLRSHAVLPSGVHPNGLTGAALDISEWDQCGDGKRLVYHRKIALSIVVSLTGKHLQQETDSQEAGQHKGLIVDQTIEKVSFCAPDRNHEKGFAYICRDGTTRRWMCHGFLAIKETGERLSHAVGCAFAICLERKQKREKESVTVTFNDKGTSFTRTGSFRQTTLTERLADPQSAIVAEPVPLKPQENPHAVQRPHATVDMLQRQFSFRGFQKLGETSPFKRQLSLRMNELPSTLDRQKTFGNALTNGTTVTTIPEASPTKEKQEESISEMCQQLSQGLNALDTDDPFASAPNSAALVAAHQQQNSPAANNIPANAVQSAETSNNPWGSPETGVSGANKIPDAEFWLSAATSIAKDSTPTKNSAAETPPLQSAVINTGTVMNGVVQSSPGPSPNPLAIQQSSPWASPAPTPIPTQPQQLHFSPAQRAPYLGQIRSHSVDTAEVWQQHHQKAPMLRDISNRGQVAQFTSQTQQGSVPAQWSSVGNSGQTAAAFPVDPFDAAWATKPSAKSNNPFHTGDTSITKTFEVNL
ncbi:hypothetical protein LSH36_463g01019 [Paralvinella palmiformis]|uniref:PID domain-containing protein n=1 Tax=Paralvinella palmiformis TaxID=53620 RepID=A0AAD9MXK9_9ANNE|nr:hypothetical protein LSH36_463g01019 [Paralvinella palmiformis]